MPSTTPPTGEGFRVFMREGQEDEVSCIKEEFIGAGWGQVRCVLQRLARDSVIRQVARFTLHWLVSCLVITKSSFISLYKRDVFILTDFLECWQLGPVWKIKNIRYVRQPDRLGSSANFRVGVPALFLYGSTHVIFCTSVLHVHDIFYFIFSIILEGGRGEIWLVIPLKLRQVSCNFLWGQFVMDASTKAMLASLKQMYKDGPHSDVSVWVVRVKTSTLLYRRTSNASS